MGWRHAVTPRINNKTSEQAWLLSASRDRSLMAVGREFVLHSLPEVRIHDRIVLAGISHTLIEDLTTVEPVLQKQVKRTA
jgi:hypothetical protein